MNLRDTLLAALARLPGTREFHLHVLVTAPRKTTSLFPYAIPKPRAQVQDILVLVSEQPTADAPRKFVTALEANVYTLPSTSSGILYVSKVDSTGQGMRPSPTYAVARAFIGYYMDPSTRPICVDHLWVHLFARAQGQYLFPNSAEYQGKQPLSDMKLCLWWKRVFSDVAQDVRRAQGTATMKMGLYHVLPGYGEMEAVQALKDSDRAASISWIYGHPYAQTEITLPCPPGKENLGHYIPCFEDDPKSRFMDELGCHVRSPRRKRRRAEEELGELEKVGVDEFWERMCFRQECVAGAVTGFFTVGITCGGSREATPGEGQVTLEVKQRVVTTLTRNVEFSTSERGIRGTEIVESAIRGLCEGCDVYGRVSVDNSAAGGKMEAGPAVRVLRARKKTGS